MTERVSPFLAWGDFHMPSRLPHSTIHEEKWGVNFFVSGNLLFGGGVGGGGLIRNMFWGVNARFSCHLGYSGQNSNNVPIYRFA